MYELKEKSCCLDFTKYNLFKKIFCDTITALIFYLLKNSPIIKNI